MNPLLVCLVSSGVFVGSIVNGPQQSPLRFDEMHHAYIGAAVCAAGSALHSKKMQWVGAIVLADDATQHLYQRMNNDLAIRSPLNIGFRFTFGRVPLVNQIGRLLDTVLK